MSAELGAPLMHVVMPTSSFPRHPHDAAGVFLLPLVHALQARGVRITVVAPDDAGTAPLPGVHVVRFAYGARPLFYGVGALQQARALGIRAVPPASRALLHMAQAIRGLRADVVLAHWLFPAGLAGALVHHADGTPLVTMVHGSDVRVLGRWAPLRWAARQAHTVVAPSGSLRADAQRILGVPAVTLRLPVDMHPHPPTFPAHDVGFLGRLIPQKGLEVLVRAAARCGASLLVGGDGPARARCADLARQCGGRVTWAGWIDPAQRASFLASVRLLAVPSLQPEGQPAVMAEAAACGVPVVGARVAGVAEHLPPDMTAAPGNVAAWAALLERHRDPAWWNGAQAWCHTFHHEARNLGMAWKDALERAAG